MEYEYRVIPAPRRLKRRKGITSSAELLAATLTDCINAEARTGWEYVRAEQLSAEEPGGWFRRASVVEETVMIFRRPRRAGQHREVGAAEEPEAGPEPRARPAFSVRRERPPLATERRDPDAIGSERRPGPQRGADAAPPLLRPVPRITPGDKT